MLTQTFCPNAPNGLGRLLFCCSCFKDESLLSLSPGWRSGFLQLHGCCTLAHQHRARGRLTTFTALGISPPHCAKEMGQKKPSQEAIKCKRPCMTKHRGIKKLLPGGTLIWRLMMNHIIPAGRSCPRPQITGLGSPWQLRRYTMFRGAPNFY